MHEFVVALNHNISTKHTSRLIVLMALNNSANITANDTDNDGDLAILRQYLRQYTYIDYAKVDWLAKLHLDHNLSLE